MYIYIYIYIHVYIYIYIAVYFGYTNYTLRHLLLMSICAQLIFLLHAVFLRMSYMVTVVSMQLSDVQVQIYALLLC